MRHEEWRATDRPVRRQKRGGSFGRAGSEHDPIGLGADQRGNVLAGLIDEPARSATVLMHGRRIGSTAERHKHRITRRGQQRRACIVVEIGPLGAHGLPLWASLTLCGALGRNFLEFSRQGILSSRFFTVLAALKI